MARELRSIAFPAISTGAYGFPVNEAAGIAVRACRAMAERHPVSITLTAFDAANANALAAALDT